MKANYQIGAGLAVAALLMAVGVTASFQSFSQMKAAGAARKHTYEVISHADDLLSALKDVETGQRGYLLTGDAAFLEPYLAVSNSIGSRLETLRKRTAITAAREHLDVVSPLITDKMVEIERVIELRRNHDTAAVLAAVGGGEGKRLMDLIRVEMRDFVRVEEVALRQHDADLQSSLSQMFILIVVASLLMLLLALAFGVLIYRDSRQQLKNLLHHETERLLETQKETSLKLQEANDTLLVSEEKLAVTLNSIGDAVIATDAEERVTLLNPLAEQLTGWTLAEAAGRPVNEIFHIINQETRETSTVPIRETLAHGTIHGLANHTVLIARDGGERAIADSCAPIRNRNNQVVGAILVFRDVTKEYAEQQALRDSDEKYRQLFESSRDALMMLTPPSWGIVEANHEALRLFGAASKADFTALGPLEMSPERQPDGCPSAGKVTELIARVLREGSHFCEWEFRRMNGELFVADMLLTRMETKGVIWVQATVRDIGTRKQTEEALLKAGALQSAIFNSANFSSIATDAKGVIQIFNVGAERMLGYAAADVMNQITPADISDPEEVIARAKALSAELATPIAPGFEALVFKASRGIEDIYELTYIRKDGSRFPAVVSVTALRDDQGGIIGYLLIGTDNTARKQADDKLRTASQYARSLIEASLDPLVTISPEGKITDVNAGSVKVTGVLREKLIGTDFSDYFTEPEKAREGYREAFSKGSVTDYPLTIRHEHGRLTDVLYNASVYKDVQGNVLGVFAAARDITARKQAEAALLKAGALQSAIFNSANFSSIATDARGVIQIFNVGAERMLGYAAAEVMNQITPADISDPEEVIARAKALSIELGTPISPGFEALVFKASRGIEDIYELTYIRKDGSRFPAVVSVTALRDAQDAIIGYLLIGTDNTARKQVEAEQQKLDQRLRDQQFYTRSLIESNIDALMTTDASGIITDVNKQMEALTGSTRDELIGAPFKKCFTDPERAEAGIKLVLSEKKVTDYELTARTRDGKETVVSYNATTFYDRDRRLQGVFAAARDVTERKRFEQELQETNVEMESAKSAAEKANLAKSDFLSSMSHELRSPLNAILGFAQLMESASPLPTAAQAARIGQILQAGWHLLKLINEILDLAVIESGKVSLSLEPVSLVEVMCECQAMMEAEAQQRGISMTFPCFTAPVFVLADRTRLKQIVINLLSNAIKYNKEQGTVVVDFMQVAAPSPALGAAGPQRIRISVQDTGAGLTPQKLAQLFQPFNRLGQEASGVAGTGIGLVVTKQLAELMEGVLGVESTVGVGSVFWCELILMESPQVSARSGDTDILRRLKAPTDALMRTVLYVEDNPANMELVGQLIARRSDLKLITAINGTLGIGLARSARPDMILMDINLHGMSGIDALKILREDPVTADIPVVALSANAMPRDIELGIEAGFFRYLTKPIKVREFMDTLDEALEFAEKLPVTETTA